MAAIHPSNNSNHDINAHKPSVSPDAVGQGLTPPYSLDEAILIIFNNQNLASTAGTNKIASELARLTGTSCQPLTLANLSKELKLSNEQYTILRIFQISGKTYSCQAIAQYPKIDVKLPLDQQIKSCFISRSNNANGFFAYKEEQGTLMTWDNQPCTEASVNNAYQMALKSLSVPSSMKASPAVSKAMPKAPFTDQHSHLNKYFTNLQKAHDIAQQEQSEKKTHIGWYFTPVTDDRPSQRGKGYQIPKKDSQTFYSHPSVQALLKENLKLHTETYMNSTEFSSKDASRALDALLIAAEYDLTFITDQEMRAVFDHLLNRLSQDRQQNFLGKKARLLQRP